MSVDAAGFASADDRRPPPRVSVAMPVFNMERFVGEAVESILGQSFQDIEVVVVDDGSTDGSREIVERYARADARIRLIANDHNLGIRPALNRAWRACRAPLVARADSDDVLLPDRLREQVRFLDEHPEVAAVGGAIITIDALGRRHSTRRFAGSSRAIDALLMRRQNCFVHGAVLVRREALESLGGYRLDRAEDYDLWLRMAERWPLANIASPVMLYRQHPHQTSLRLRTDYTLGSIAALESARARRSGRRDPLEGVQHVSRTVLQDLGMKPRVFASAVRADCLDSAVTLATLGHTAEAAQLIVDLERTSGVGVSRMFAALVELKGAQRSLANGKPLPAVLHLSRALWAAPRLAAHRIATRVQTWAFDVHGRARPIS